MEFYFSINILTSFINIIDTDLTLGIESPRKEFSIFCETETVAEPSGDFGYSPFLALNRDIKTNWFGLFDFKSSASGPRNSFSPNIKIPFRIDCKRVVGSTGNLANLFFSEHFYFLAGVVFVEVSNILR